MAAFGPALGVNTSLEMLELYDCGICRKGVEHLAEGLKANSTLKELWMEGNGELWAMVCGEATNGFHDSNEIENLLRDATNGRVKIYV